MLRDGGRVLTFGDLEDDTGTGGWFTPARKSPPQSPDSASRAGEADFGGGASWFTPSRPESGPPSPGGWPEDGGLTFRGQDASIGVRDAGIGVRDAGVGGHQAAPQGYHEQGWGDPGRPPVASQDFSRQDRGPDRRDPRGRGDSRGDSSAWREIPARGATAANRWAEVTRGGTPASVNPNRRPAGDDFPPSGLSPSGLSSEPGFPPSGVASDPGFAPSGFSLDRGLEDPGPQDVPFRGARPIDVSSSRNPPARRSPAYSAHSAAAASGALSTGQRRSETGALRRLSETGALRKIRESGAIRAIMDTGAMRTLMDTTAMQMLRERYAGRGKAVAIAGICLWTVLSVAAIVLVVKHIS